MEPLTVFMLATPSLAVQSLHSPSLSCPKFGNCLRKFSSHAKQNSHPWQKSSPKRLSTAVAAPGQEDANVHSIEEEWDSKTTTLASGATAVFAILLLPQIIRNGQNIARGHYTALAAIAWVVSFCS